MRRNFEDEFVAQLRVNGLDAVPSYRYASGDERIDEAKLKEVVKAAGADAAIIARPVNVEQKTEVGPSYIRLRPSAFLAGISRPLGTAFTVRQASTATTSIPPKRRYTI
jgi:hypothetical protein